MLDQIQQGPLHSSYVMKDAKYVFGFVCLAAEDQERAKTGEKEGRREVLIFPHTPPKSREVLNKEVGHERGTGLQECVQGGGS